MRALRTRCNYAPHRQIVRRLEFGLRIYPNADGWHADTLKPFAAIRQARDEWMYLKGDIKGYKELSRWRENAPENPWYVATPGSTMVNIESQNLGAATQ